MPTMNRSLFSLLNLRRNQVVAMTAIALVIGGLLVRALTSSDEPSDAVAAETTAQVSRRDLTGTVVLTGRLEQTYTRAIYWQQPPPVATTEPSTSSGSPDGGAARGQPAPAAAPAPAPAGPTAPPAATPSPPPPVARPEAPTTTTSARAPSITAATPPDTTTSTSQPSTTTTTSQPITTTSETTTKTTCETTTTTSEPTTTTVPQPIETTPGCPETAPGAVSTQFVVVSSSTATEPDLTPPQDGTAADGDTTTHTLTSLAAGGQELAAGDVLFAVDDQPTVLMLGADAAFRDLADGVDDGPDVAQLEQNLAALGYTDGGDLVVDEHFDDATTAAVDDWQETLGVEATGTVELGDVVFLPDPVTVAATKATVGDLVDPGAHLLDVSAETLVAVGAVPVRLLGEIVEGSAATITLADGTPVPGTIRAIGDQATRDAETPVADSTVELTVQLDASDSPAAVNFAAVTLAVTTANRSNVRTVPVAAVVDGGDGQTSVRVPADGDVAIAGGSRDGERLVDFDPGLSAGGYVEVLDGVLPEGASVLLPGRIPSDG
jgi:peptidoglycan hydrolase-like protein with peptidoglycan-binding domain